MTVSRRSNLTLILWFLFAVLIVGVASAMFSTVAGNSLIVLVPGSGMLVLLGVVFLLSRREKVAFNKSKLNYQPVLGSVESVSFHKVDRVRMYQQEKKVVVGDHRSWSWWLSFYDQNGRKLTSFDVKILNQEALQKLTGILESHGLTIIKNK
ncbi:hypothetical protein [Salisediminibacterium selenitireducens]|uniref:Uncharacterized protein n=1 Tax=Bacillus selenitireducens (strain ATCC 700615 / DSM 15326 / MLS10) TaxID=439292 RepID=D6XZI5_BACIE|nr:hypothetical protein [Salisediminibacterium selenitireducens]ADH98359.1 hypothetical protein Bsel_0831 [[Bacillus] selenitireducens MLS10]